MPILDLGDPEPTISDGALASVCWGNKEHFSSTPPNFTTVCPYLFIFHLLSLSHNLHYTLFFITLCPSLLSCLSPAPSVCHCRWLPLIELFLFDGSYHQVFAHRWGFINLISGLDTGYIYGSNPLN